MAMAQHSADEFCLCDECCGIQNFKLNKNPFLKYPINSYEGQPYPYIKHPQFDDAFDDMFNNPSYLETAYIRIAILDNDIYGRNFLVAYEKTDITKHIDTSQTSITYEYKIYRNTTIAIPLEKFKPYSTPQKQQPSIILNPQILKRLFEKRNKYIKIHLYENIYYEFITG